jgi:hypothetical protein
MSEIISREAIAKMADQAAQLYARTGRMEACPYAPGTDEAKVWAAAFERFLILHSNPEGEASA